MLRGHVDQITRRLVIGWAADDADPDGIVDVSLFVDGVKVAEIPCDLARTDLKNTLGLGQGRHGFRYEFASELPVDSQLRVTLRFASSGALLGNGDAVLASGQTAPAFIVARPGDENRPRLPAPVDPQSLLRTLAIYEEGEGLYELLRRLTFVPHRLAKHIHYIVFGEYPAPLDAPSPLPEHLARDLLNDLLHSERFQQEIVASVLRAYPDKKRLLFIHIPKCAGSDLSVHFSARFPSIGRQLSDPRLTSKERFFASVSKLSRVLPFADFLFVKGHINLSHFVDLQLIRPIDRCFTVVRDPIEMAISQVNYVMSRIRWNSESGIVEPDTKNWLNVLGMTDLPPEVSDEFAENTCRSALLNPELVRPNPICEWLGGGTAGEVLARLCEHDVEVTDTAHYNAWLRQEWQIDAQTRQNESIKYITPGMLSQRELSYLTEITAEDNKVYQAVVRGLAESRSHSIVVRNLRSV